MKLFLMIVGGFLVAFAIFVLLILLWIRAKIRGFASTIVEGLKGMAEAAKAFPTARLELKRASGLVWDDPAGFERAAGAVRDAGFNNAGEYTVESRAGLKIAGFAHPGKSVYAAIYEMPPSGIWVDFVTRYADGTAVTYSNARYHGLDRPPEKLAEFHDGMAVEELYRRFLEQRPTRPMLPTPPEDFAAAVERYHAEEMDWRLKRGGLTEEEIRRVAARDGSEASEQMIRHTQRLWWASVTGDLEAKLRASYQATVSVPVAEWESVRDRLVLVHDYLRADDLVEKLGWAAEEDEDGEETVRQRLAELGNCSSREAFARLNATFPAAQQHRLLGKVDRPVEADVYAAPEIEDEDGEDAGDDEEDEE